MIKGKLEATREIAPNFMVTGESQFVRAEGEWKVRSEPETDVEVVDLQEAFIESAAPQPTNPAIAEPPKKL